MIKILLINGPNLNLLGTREPALYGSETLPSIEASLMEAATHLGADLRCFQSNHEGEIIEAIHTCLKDVDGLLLNPAGYGHTSVAIRDALLAVGVPTVEVHLTNISRREDFRRRTLTGDVAIGQISGFGSYGYHLALSALVNHLQR
jgi:3-dehydroquinate dehydratase II